MTAEHTTPGPQRERKQVVPLGSTGVEPEKPKMQAQAPAPQKEVTIETADGPVTRRRRASVGGFSLKLGAKTRPGFTRRWFNDDGNRIADAHDLGYDHVTEEGITSSDPSSRISRLVGTKANGEPLRAYLMETPDELFAEGVAEKEARNRLVDDAITAGCDSTGQMTHSETYGQGSIQRDR
jgi:hypothetical protein